MPNKAIPTLETPVVLIAFNRPELTRQVFEQIRKVKPSIFFFVSDGPRISHPEDGPKCEKVKQILSEIDWPCKVHSNISKSNLGCKNRVSSGISWVFEHVESAIILEDDCLPESSFFFYCQELLIKYEKEPKVMAIGGANLLNGHFEIEASYYFSRYVHIWGWATWKRAWNTYDVEINEWKNNPESKTIVTDTLTPNRQREYWYGKFDQVAAGKIDTWDYQWTFAIWKNKGLSIVPRVNMIKNIGFGIGATHTVFPDEPCANLPTQELPFPLTHPPRISPYKAADEYSESTYYSRTFLKRVYQYLKKVTHQLLTKI